jgi:acyl transferase domain-containing protein
VTEALSPVKRALVELRALRARVAELEAAAHDPIAVVGVGCRLPGADGPDAFWELLREGVDAVRETPPGRWDADAYYDPDPDAPGRMSTRWGGFLDGVDLFDAEAFGITPREAAAMDPQQRLLLEVAWEALEHAGQAPDGLTGSKTGVFVGISTSDYLELRLMRGGAEGIDPYLPTGGTNSVASGRLSYVFGLRGPSVSVDTACSSSLVAVHLAVASLRRGESDLALAGGANLMLLPETTIALSKARMLAPDGRCKAFDARADGFVRAEGCGIVVLKRLADAVADGDDVLAVIRGTAVNQDGRSNGLTAPNALSQEALLRDALADAGVAAGDVDYVEAHGTGTSLGDPIEVGALAAVYGEGRPADRPLAIGSVKTNMGHLEAAAGVTGLVKAVLSLRHGEIPPHLHLRELNPYVPWKDLPLVVPVERTPWPAEGRPRRAGVSSFGFSGTNAHVVLEEAPEPAARPDAACPRRRHLLCLSAHDEPALRELAGRYQAQLAGNLALPLAAVCSSAGSGRAQLAHRLALPVDLRSGAAAAAELRERLAAAAAGLDHDGVIRGAVGRGERPEVAFLFTGQGAPLHGAARLLDETEPVFRDVLDRCDELAEPRLPRSLRSILCGDAQGASPGVEAVAAQPALFALQCGLAELWRSWGVVPDVVLGHSVGEYAAAYVAGVLTLEDALDLVTTRGLLTAPLGGAMAVARAGEERVAAAVAECGGAVALAAVNGPDSVVVSGADHAVEAVRQRLEADGVETRSLATTFASHSPLVEPILDTFGEAAGRIRYSRPHTPFVSSLTGELTVDEVSNPEYWRRHLREPVRFAAAARTLARIAPDVKLELGPKPVLLALAHQSWPKETPEGHWLASLRPDVEADEQVLEALGGLYAAGVRIDWEGFEGDRRGPRVPLPTYPWQRRSHWLAGLGPAPEAERRSSWEAVVEAASFQSERGPLDLALETHADRWRSLDELALGAMVATLRGVEGLASAGGAMTALEIAEALGIQADHRKLLLRWLETLAREGLLERRDGAFAASAPLPEPDLAALAAGARARFADTTLPDYLERCAARLGSVLRGETTALELLFPGGSFETAECLYERLYVARYANGVARAALEAFAQSRAGSLNVLEVGAGTGGTAAALVPALPRGASYRFTDVSELFLARARERFAGHEAVSYGVLDLERDPADQGYAAGGFDVVVAANVVHATRVLAQTLARIRSLLAPGGLLLLYETTSHPVWLDISVSLIEGWGRFADELRRDSPLLPAAAWEALLSESGFEAVAAWPSAGSPADVLGVHVLAAQAPETGDAARAEPKPSVEAAAAAGEGGEAPPASSPYEAAGEERLESLVELVRLRVREVTRSDPARPLRRRDRLMDVGVDSLMAVELSARLTRDLDLPEPLPATLIFDHSTVEAVAEYLDERLAGPETQDAAPVASVHPADVAALSDAEVEALLLDKLDARGRR